MKSESYVWEKMYTAINCMCGDGSFKKRLENATISALIRLDDDDLTGELAEYLHFVLHWSKNNMRDGKLLKEPDEIERDKLIENMLHIMLETHTNS